MRRQLVAADEQRAEPLGKQVQHPHRAIAVAAPALCIHAGAGVDNEQLAVAVPDAFAAAHAQRAIGPGLRERAAQGVVGADVGKARWCSDAVQIRLFDVDPFQPELLADAGHGEVGVALATHTRGLQPAAVLQRAVAAAAVVGNEAVQPGLVTVVFGEIDDAGARVDRHRLMAEAAQPDQRPAGGAVAVRVHFEHVAVLAPGAGDRIGLDLFAAQPGAPGRRTAGAIDQGAAQARFQAAPAAPPIAQRGGAAAGLRGAADDAGVVHRRRTELAGGATLMVADQHVFQAAQAIGAGAPAGPTQADHGHAVIRSGQGWPSSMRSPLQPNER